MKNPYIHLLSKSWYFAQEKRISFLLAISFFIVANSLMLLQPYFFGQVLNTLQRWGPDLWHDFVLYLCIYSIIPFFFWILHGNGRVIERSTAFHIGKNCKEYIFSIITELPFAWHSDNHSGETINKVNKATQALEQFSDDNFMYIQTMVRFVGSLIGISLISWYLGVAATLAWVTIIGIILLFDKRLIPQYRAIFEREHKVASLLHDYISNIRTVITLHFEALAKHELISKIETIFPLKKQNFILNELKWFSTNMFIDILVFGIIFWYWYHQLQSTGIILAGNLVILYQYLERFSGSFYSFAWSYERIVKMNTEVQTIDSIIGEHAKLVKTVNPTIGSHWESIRLKNWNFAYGTGRDKHTLKHINMELRRWAKIAMIWESGSGKSTMASLIKWLYTPESGSLTIDQQQHKDLTLLSAITTLIPQDPEIFENTLMYNVTFGIETAPEHIADAVRLARFDSVIDRLPNWLETNIKEKWVNLSWGEKQRLALARWLFMARDQDIIIMDEPTSSVDPANETIIYKSIFQEYPNKCIISAIHRLHLLPMFDMIYLFDNGEIVESGSFAELLAQKWRFSVLWEQYRESSK